MKTNESILDRVIRVILVLSCWCWVGVDLLAEDWGLAFKIFWDSSPLSPGWWDSARFMRFLRPAQKNYKQIIVSKKG